MKDETKILLSIQWSNLVRELVIFKRKISRRWASLSFDYYIGGHMNYLFSIITRLLRNNSSKFISLVFSSFSQKALPLFLIKKEACKLDLYDN